MAGGEKTVRWDSEIGQFRTATHHAEQQQHELGWDRAARSKPEFMQRVATTWLRALKVSKRLKAANRSRGRMVW